MSFFTPVDVNSPQRETIYEQLKAAILNGDIKPNERIVEMKYAEIFNVSRTPVREAIRMLEQEQLVIYVPHKGAVARPMLSEEEIEEIYTVRATLQMLSVDAVVKHITATELKAMRENNRACAKALEEGNEDAYFLHLEKFNDILTLSSRMPLLIRLLDQIEGYNPATAFMSSGRGGGCEFSIPIDRRYETLQEHIAITEALSDKDMERFRATLQVHTVNVKKAAIQSYREHCKSKENNKKKG